MPRPSKIEIFDTTLRDGSQGEDVSLSVEDKLAIAEKLASLGIDWIEGGWPAGSNKKDIEFFRLAKKRGIAAGRLVAFGSTSKSSLNSSDGGDLAFLAAAETPGVCIFGKSWKLHVTEVLKVTPEDNLKMIRNSVQFLKSKGKVVFYDAEHFFDGFKDDAGYAFECIEAARSAGADVIVLCDTNGGCLPWDISGAVKRVVDRFPGVQFGIHAHNDSDTAVANTLAAVEAGAVHVQGTMNGLGERCGNANLVSVLADLHFKLKYKTIPEASFEKLTEVAHEVSSIANIPIGNHQPFVGMSAFAHKAGVHIDAVLKVQSSYEHLDPVLVGNERRFLASEQSGKAAIMQRVSAANGKMSNMVRNLNLNIGSEQAKRISELIKQREFEGYQYEGADASLDLLIKRATGSKHKFFDLVSYDVSVQRKGKVKPAEATVKIRVGKKAFKKSAKGHGPVNALDIALRSSLAKAFPALKKCKLTDYKVRVLASKGGTDAKVRVLMETTDGPETWNTVGVHENIIEASWEALVDSVEYKLLKDGVKA